MRYTLIPDFFGKPLPKCHPPPETIGSKKYPGVSETACDFPAHIGCGRLAICPMPADMNQKAGPVKAKPPQSRRTSIHALRKVHPCTFESPPMHSRKPIQCTTGKSTHALPGSPPMHFPEWNHVLFGVEPCNLTGSARPFDRHQGAFGQAHCTP